MVEPKVDSLSAVGTGIASSGAAGTDDVTKRAFEIFTAALEREAGEKERFVGEACADDYAVRDEVERLFAVYKKAEEDGIFAKRLTLNVKTLLDDPIVGQTVEKYRIESVLGDGGMGTVYLAEQSEPIQRTVALKIIKLGMDTRQTLARFEVEREALSLMNHPNVARVLDAGATDSGRPYFVMEYVDGSPITGFCDQKRLSTKERIKLFMDVCAAVQHAHQKGIMHRDIKPSNVLITEVDGKPVPKVIDFGIAKATQPSSAEQTNFTQTGQLVGTPAYMSPEQVGGNPADIDTRTDVYSLGILLYELLSGTMPFDDTMLRQAGHAELQRNIREVELPKPSTRLKGATKPRSHEATEGSKPRVSARGSLMEIAQLRRTDLRTLLRELRGDLDWVVMKCLEKDRTRRYETPNALATELQRYVNNEPVQAGPPSAVYRLKKFARRNKSAVAAISGIVAVLIGGATTSTVLYLRAVEAEQQQSIEREAAESARDESEAVTMFLSDMLASVRPEEQGKDVSVRQLLDKAGKTVGDKLSGQPLVEARLQQTIGTSYFTLGLYSEAERHFVDAATTYRRVLGERDRRTLASVNDLALAIGVRGTFSAAEAFLRSTLEIQRRVLGEEHADTVLSMGNLALALRSQSRYPEAEEVERKTLDIRGRILGPEHPATLGSMNGLATGLHFQGRDAEAQEIFQRTFDIQRRVLGDEHPDTVKSMSNVALALRCQGQYREAEELYQKTLDISRRVLGETHPFTLASGNNLAITLDSQGHYAEAEAIHRNNLDNRRRVLGEEHPQTIGSMSNLAIAVLAQGCYAEAKELFQKTLNIERRVLGEEHSDTLGSMHNLAEVLYLQALYQEAEDLHRKTLVSRRRTLGEAHPDAILSLQILANVCYHNAKIGESADLYREAIKLRQQRTVGPKASAADLQEYASLLLTCKVEHLQDSQAALAQAVQAVEMTRGQNFNMLATLALAYQKSGQRDKAIETQRKSLALLPSEGSPKRAELESKLGEYAAEQKNFAEAESLLLSSYRWMKDHCEAPPDRLKDFVECIVKLYESWDAAELGMGYAEKTAEWRAKLDELTTTSDSSPVEQADSHLSAPQDSQPVGP